ncbi:MAG: hypothetical protein OK438_01935 [Thaumarchaeota archaeon]|nr:hypothetical protein [Nitrososphaerota archaeon]
MKTTTIAASAIVALLLTGVAAIAFAHPGFLQSGSSTSGIQGSQHGNDTRGDQVSSQHNENDTKGDQSSSQHQQNETRGGGDEGGFNLTVGQTLVFANLTGHSNNLTNESLESDDHDNSGASNSTGSFTFKVTSSSEDGFNLTITKGTFTINGTTYVVTGGNVTLNDGGDSASGSGTATGGVTFTIHLSGIHGNTSSTAPMGAIRLDVKAGSSEYLVVLGTHEASEETSED